MSKATVTALLESGKYGALPSDAVFEGAFNLARLDQHDTSQFSKTQVLQTGHWVERIL